MPMSKTCIVAPATWALIRSAGPHVAKSGTAFGTCYRQEGLRGRLSGSNSQLAEAG
jgi:hypothetical protein